MRLDQQRLDRYHPLDRQEQPLFGTILWDSGAAQVKDQDLEMLKALVEQGASVLVIGDAIASPRLAALAGVRYVSRYLKPPVVYCHCPRGQKGNSGQTQGGRLQSVCKAWLLEISFSLC